MDGPQNPKSRVISGGEKGIRTPGTLARSPDFESIRWVASDSEEKYVLNISMHLAPARCLVGP